MRRLSLMVCAVAMTSVLGALGGCDSIHDPNVRPAAVLPDGPVTTTSSSPKGMLCADGSYQSQHGGSCPSAKAIRQAEKDRVARVISDIHAHGG
jgi:hypothetical protein